MLAVLVLTLPASAGGGALATLEANLTGEQEVPGPGDLNGSGYAVLKILKTKVCYTLEVRRIALATAAHIHLGLRREAGCVEIPRALSLELIEHPARYYVNVHNDPFPDGAIRGQLHR